MIHEAEEFGSEITPPLEDSAYASSMRGERGHGPRLQCALQLLDLALLEDEQACELAGERAMPEPSILRALLAVWGAMLRRRM